MVVTNSRCTKHECHIAAVGQLASGLRRVATCMQWMPNTQNGAGSQPTINHHSASGLQHNNNSSRRKLLSSSIAHRGARASYVCIYVMLLLLSSPSTAPPLPLHMAAAYSRKHHSRLGIELEKTQTHKCAAESRLVQAGTQQQHTHITHAEDGAHECGNAMHVVHMYSP